MNITGPARERGENAGKDWGMEGPTTHADVSVCWQWQMASRSDVGVCAYGQWSV